MTRLFGFIQFDLAGALPVPDGRYVLRDGERERVLVVETLGAPPPGRRRRRKPRQVNDAEPPGELPLARVTIVRAFAPFEGEQAAHEWLDSTSRHEEDLQRVIEEATADVNRALHAQATAAGDSHPQAVDPARAAAARIGYGEGAELADGAFTAGLSVDPMRGAASRRRTREEGLRPQQRLAAVLGGREQLDACETLLLRARADLDAGRHREAALQLRVGLEALLVELDGALDDPGHTEDMAKLSAHREAVTKVADSAVGGELSVEQLKAVGDLLATGERVVRRRRVFGD